jgi:hypothetical protein
VEAVRVVRAALREAVLAAVVFAAAGFDVVARLAGAAFVAVVFLGAAVLVAVLTAVALTAVVLAGADFDAVARLAGAAFVAVAFRGAVVLAAVVLAAVVLAAAVLAAPVVAAVVLAVVARLAGAAFVAVDFVAGAFLAAVDLGAAVLAGALRVVARGAAARAAVLTAGFAAALAAEPVLIGVTVAGARPAAIRTSDTSARGSFFGFAVTSLKKVLGLKRGTDVLRIFTLSPVRGLRPTRAFRATFSKEPNPLIATFSPLATARVMVSTTASTASVATFRLPRRDSSAATSSALFTAILR